MPCITTKINLSVADTEIKMYQDKLSELIKEQLSKPADFIMTIFEMDKKIGFAGNSDPAAFIELKSIGLTEQNALELSRDICALVESDFSIKKDRVYIEFTNAPGAFWGWNGTTFQSL